MSVDELSRLLETDLDVSHRLAARVKEAADVNLPKLELWNYGPCKRHDEPKVDCEYRRCGGDLFEHQRKGVSWLYFIRKGILADQTGLGKTNQVIGLACLLKQRDELPRRAVIVCQPTAIDQWFAEFRRFAPGIRVETATGNPGQRIQRYSGRWDVIIIGYQMMLRDIKRLLALAPGLVVEDDVDPIRSTANATAKAYNRLAMQADRVVNINATPLQTKLQELYATSVSVGGLDKFGSIRQFERRFIRVEPVASIIVKSKNGQRTRVTKTQVVGYRNMREFRELFEPFYLRRRYDQVDDVKVPEVLPPQTEWFDLYPPQRAKYEQLQDEVLHIMKENGEEDIRHAVAWQKFGYGAQICAGLPALGESDGPGASVKLDWLERQLTGDWAGEKVVVFSKYKGTIRALKVRMDRHGVGVALIWGDTPGDSRRKMELRKAEQDRFWTDPRCRVAVGTSAIERSLNFQVARIIVNFDLLLNPARMVQILGRIRRVGSSHSHVLPVNLLCRNTQEEGYMRVLEERAALAGYVFDESSDLFKALSPADLMKLIRP